jgi:hypothetical protein
MLINVVVVTKRIVLLTTHNNKSAEATEPSSCDHDFACRALWLIDFNAQAHQHFSRWTCCGAEELDLRCTGGVG